MTRNYLIVFFLLIITLLSCGGKTVSLKNDKTQSSNNDSLQSDTNQMVCKYSDSNYEFEFEGCSCGKNSITSDTIFIDLNPAYYEGEIQGNFIRVNTPKCDNSYYILMKFQNRYWTSSMGPDPIMDDWILYNSPYDTVKYDKNNNGFYIDTIPYKDQIKFPQFDTLDFYKAYYRANNRGFVTEKQLQNPPKSKIDNYKKHADEIFGLSSAELHKIILLFQHNSKTEKVIVISYGHMG